MKASSFLAGLSALVSLVAAPNSTYLPITAPKANLFKELTKAAKAHGSLFISQLSHVGRQGGKHLNPQPVSASDVQLTVKWGGNEFNKPRPLGIEEIAEIVQNFADSAYNCWEARYDGVQVSI